MAETQKIEEGNCEERTGKSFPNHFVPTSTSVRSETSRQETGLMFGGGGVQIRRALKQVAPLSNSGLTR